MENTDKDIALQDRIKLFYPNISLCDEGCVQTSVNLINKTANCECEFNDISDTKKEDSKGENVFLENLLGDVLDFIDKSNIAVGKCIKESVKLIKKSYGFYITLSLLICDIISSVIFYLIELNKIKIYIYDNTQNYLKLLGTSENIFNSPPLKKYINNKNKNKEKNKNVEKNKIILKTNNNTQESLRNNKRKKQNIINNNKIESLRIMTVTNNIDLKSKEKTKDNFLLSSLKSKNRNSKSKF